MTNNGRAIAKQKHTEKECSDKPNLGTAEVTLQSGKKYSKNNINTVSVKLYSPKTNRNSENG